MRYFTVSLLMSVFLSTVAYAGTGDTVPPVVFPTISARAQTKADFVPKGWIIEKEGNGDLNGDGVPDVMFVLHMNDPRNVIKNSGLGESKIDTNPRMLVIVFADKATNKYSLALANHTLIPRHTNPVMEDPFDDAKIIKGTIQVSLGLWMSAGGWGNSTFRYQEGCFKLIGYDSTETQRNTGETSDVSINYLTKKEKIVKGNIENDNKKISWKSIAISSLLCLDAVGNGLDFSPEN